MHKDSVFAAGTAIRFPKYPGQIKEIDNSNKKLFDALKYFKEAEYLPLSAIAALMKCSRRSGKKIVDHLWMVRLIKCIEVVTCTEPERIFKLWMQAAKGRNMPKNANEACRLAVLGTFYSRVANVLPEIEWSIIQRGKEKKYVSAAMTYLPAGKREKSTLIVDAPRRGEKPSQDADIYIFPTVEEAKLFTPKGKRYTTDFVLMNKDIEYVNLISDPVIR